MLKVLDVDGAVRRVRGGWVATGEPWTYDTERLRAGRRGPRRPSSRRCGSTRTRPAAGWSSCAAASTTRRRRPAAGATAAPGRCSTPRSPPAALAAAQAFLGRPGVEIAPEEAVADRPGGGRRAAARARSPPASRPRRAGPSGRLSDLGWGDRLRDLLADGRRRTRPMPDDLAARGGRGAQGLGARRRRRGRQRPVGRGGGRLAPPPAAGREPGRAHRHGRPAAAARHGRPSARRRPTPAARQQRPAGPGAARRVRRAAGRWPPRWPTLTGPVLLVDDLVDSGWTMALVARLLRQAGAPAVLPLALAVAADSPWRSRTDQPSPDGGHGGRLASAVGAGAAVAVDRGVVDRLHPDPLAVAGRVDDPSRRRRTARRGGCRA